MIDKYGMTFELIQHLDPGYIQCLIKVDMGIKNNYLSNDTKTIW